MADKVTEFSATGRRKTSVARVHLAPGTGKWMVNSRTAEHYFCTEAVINYIQQPMKATDTLARFDLRAELTGGGVNGQAGALRHAISRALCLADISNRKVLKESGCLTRDSRMKERKKYGQPGARARFQFSKR
ncbi:MAG: 30S ribosomal protein S9 [Kiritimatiellia bacterium]